MKRKKQTRRQYTALPGRGSSPASSLEPPKAPDEETSQSPPEPRSVPIGRPIAPEEYKRLKKEAEKVKRRHP
jgi:hypothetical protein